MKRLKEVVRKKVRSKYLWVIDAGHGMWTRGKRSTMRNGDTFYEYHWNRKVKDGIIEELCKLGIECIDLVPEVAIGNALWERIFRISKIKTEKPIILISIHFNAGPGKYTRATGVETWYKNNCKESKKIAKDLQSDIVYYTGLISRGIKTKKEKEFFILRNFKGHAAVLTENGFFNNQTEVERLIKPATIRQIIRGHVEAIKRYEGWY